MIIKLTDTMKEIQSKLNSSKDIKFAKGTYKITKQLVINSDSIIDLNGAVLQRKASIQSIFINKVTKKTTKYNGDGNIIIKVWEVIHMIIFLHSFTRMI